MLPRSGPDRITRDIGDVRRHHLSIVLSALVADGPRSRAALAAETGLTKGTVSALVADLLARDLVEELDTPKPGRVGRPATDVAAGGRVGGLGLVLDVDHVAAAVVDLGGAVRIRRRLAGDNRRAPSETVVDRLAVVARGVLSDADAAGIRCAGGALALPGLVDPVGQTLLVAPNLGWGVVDLSDARDRIGLPPDLGFTVDNEANLAALAELRHGAGRDLSSFVYVSGGVGVGAGVVLDGRLVRGAHGFAGELGHVVVDPTGRPCRCGSRGCLETIVGSGAEAGPEEIAVALATALRTVVQIVDPEAVVLGGSFAAGGEDLAATVRDRLQGTALSARWPCDVRPAALAADATVIGAARTALDGVVADPTLVPAP